MSRLRRTVATAALAAALAGPAWAAAPPIAWFAMETDAGVPVGYASVEFRDLADGRERIEYQETTLREQEERSTRISQRTVVREDRQGRIRSLVSEIRVGRSRAVVEAVMGDGLVEVSRQTPAGRTVVRVPSGPDVRFDGGEGLFAGWDPATKPRLEFASFNIDALAVERVVVEADRARDADGKLAILRTTYQDRDLRGVSRMTLGRDGQVLAITQPMFGTSITVRPTDKATAQRSRPPYRVMTSLMSKSPFRISGSAAEGHIRYRFGFKGALNFPMPQTGEQKVAVTADGVQVDICERCGPGLGSDPAFLAEATRPTAWLQSDDPKLKSIVAGVAAQDISDRRKMEILTRTARAYLGEIDFSGHFSALETLQRRRGDCTEAAVMVAARGRAAGIPTKVASGYVYSRERYHGVSNVFMPHSWALAYVDGKWVSFDAALPAFTSTHIAVTIGDGDPRAIGAAGQLASLLEWKQMAEVKARPA